jgi:hypothetical protein
MGSDRAGRDMVVANTPSPADGGQGRLTVETFLKTAPFDARLPVHHN